MAFPFYTVYTVERCVHFVSKAVQSVQNIRMTLQVLCGNPLAQVLPQLCQRKFLILAFSGRINQP